jgi:hypothetical protein
LDEPCQWMDAECIAGGCAPRCDAQAADPGCPEPRSGTASPSCDFNFCYVFCGFGDPSCPDGMLCSGNTCGWP